MGAPSLSALAHAVAAIVLRHESNLRAVVSILGGGEDAEAIAAELRRMAGEHATAAMLLKAGPGLDVGQDLAAALRTAAGELQGPELAVPACPAPLEVARV